MVQETQVRPLSWEDTLEKGIAIHSSILARRSHGWRSLTGYTPWGHREFDMTEQLTHFHLQSESLDYVILLLQ